MPVQLDYEPKRPRQRRPWHGISGWSGLLPPVLCCLAWPAAWLLFNYSDRLNSDYLLRVLLVFPLMALTAAVHLLGSFLALRLMLQSARGGFDPIGVSVSAIPLMGNLACLCCFFYGILF